ncbi:hypothetical protein, conserved [Trypanosoma brucei gambiense DAL972]|uniref:Uncharacterized protein n=2 Tax=Trypanosoma brucei TaxID=5691 RepID=D0A357_TRYB9|nr:hypothetical protein, conserved [Trypanosoma brucei gambiense DAL972]RHW69645.1 2OG-Fe(II) oxygenase superfamily [Trypanosoma brucei equiperdum]CBH15701.1 hypothetical protein, conserved [Trypanosoma brucei gambiense DAL972]|eukprot:XP_011777965.1 hypothetical protein, conserved [Trypanosoma brucei gambiense DAL972]
MDHPPAGPFGGGECRCTGIRFCQHCIDSDRAQSIVRRHVSLANASDVVLRQYTDQRMSSCSFACVGPSLLSMCCACKTVFETAGGVLKCCGDHKGFIARTDIELSGLTIQPGFVSPNEEEYLVAFFDNPAPFAAWKVSQSGRRKQEYGPKANFKKRKLKVGDFRALPHQMKTTLDRVRSFVAEQTMREYCIVEVSVLEYTAECSCLDPHIDDTWLWGDRIGGLNLLDDVTLTFVSADEVAVTVFVPRGAFFLLTGVSRYEWMHGIRREDVKNRRVSVTFREFADNLVVDQEILKTIVMSATTFT